MKEVKVEAKADDKLMALNDHFQYIQNLMDADFDKKAREILEDLEVKSPDMNYEELREWIFDYVYNHSEQTFTFSEYLAEHGIKVI